MKKISVIGSMFLLSALFYGCGGTNVTVLPPPKYAEIIVKASPIVGRKIDTIDPEYNSRDFSGKFTAKNDSVVILDDGTSKFEITFFNQGSNLTYLTVKQQVPNIVGRRDPFATSARDHGYYMPKDKAGNTINELSISVNIGDKKWLYLVKK
jgi:hypothetical protein